MSASVLPCFLCDTWWYGLTNRLPDKRFKELALLRKKQGFTAIQLVVGIPPEIGPQNPNARGGGGAAWDLKGNFNQRYLDNARRRIQYLNSLGFLVIIYGAWGYQIEWFGIGNMINWWKHIIGKLDDLNVIYCLTGESDLWVGREKILLPDKTTDQLNAGINFSTSSLLSRAGKKVRNIIKKSLYRSRLNKRREQWSFVLTKISLMTKRSIIIHPIPSIISEEVVNNPNLLAAVTMQTGHDLNTRKDLWRLPLKYSKNYPNKPFINLEPWYEGIRDNFGAEDQLYAYWVSMMAGAHAFCYGAHGIWNVGDAKFLSHWGEQTLSQAMKLTAPKLLGQSHQFFTRYKFAEYKDVKIDYREDFIMIKRSSNEHSVLFTNDISFLDIIPEGKVFLPLEGRVSSVAPHQGQVVIFS